jgi:hypothetical protein
MCVIWQNGQLPLLEHPITYSTFLDGARLVSVSASANLPHLPHHSGACHGQLVVECPEEQTEEVARFVEEVMVAGMDEVLNPGLDSHHPETTVEVGVPGYTTPTVLIGGVAKTTLPDRAKYLNHSSKISSMVSTAFSCMFESTRDIGIEGYGDREVPHHLLNAFEMYPLN